MNFNGWVARKMHDTKVHAPNTYYKRGRRWRDNGIIVAWWWRRQPSGVRV